MNATTGQGPLQRVLAAEHAAVYVLQALAAQTSQSAQPEVFSALNNACAAHRAQRDWLVARLSGAGLNPVPAAPAYEVPAASRPDALRATALQVELRSAANYTDAVAQTVKSDRAWLVDALGAASIRLLWFRGSPEILPGTISREARTGAGVSPRP